MQKFSTVIVGGGASGIIAAISAKRKGISVVICERMGQVGKKILASGNGRCNLSNDKLDESCYNQSARPLVKSVFNRFGRDGIKNFFYELGIKLHSEEGRIFPATNQSSSVLKILEIELKRLAISIELNFDAADISYTRDGFVVTSKSNKKIIGRSLIFACGGKSYPALGSDGSAYKFAKNFGHKIIEPVPVAVPIVIKDPLCHILQGQKIFAKVKSIISGVVIGEAAGDILFTKYGLSGTSILDISEEISVAVNRFNKKDIAVAVDMAPFMTTKELEDELAKRIKKNFSTEDLLVGILPNKFGIAMKDLLKTKDKIAIAGGVKDRRFKVLGTRGWNEAEFTSGGIEVNQVREGTLESKLRKGLYFAGEILDVNGRRGGYNLAWAWASGFVAGEEAANA